MADLPPIRSRRAFIQQGAIAGLLSATAMLPSGAVIGATRKPYRVLDPVQVRTLNSVAELLVPGSVRAGISAFVDQQLAGSAADCLLMLKYLGVNPPFTDFYRSGFAALNEAASRRVLRPFNALTTSDALQLITDLSRGAVAGWSGPPAQLFFFTLRNDAVDVVYGTVQGFGSLGIPYMPHIQPPAGWLA